MKLRLFALALFVVAVLMPPMLAHAESGIVVLSGGCGSGAFLQSDGYMTIDSTGRLCNSLSGSISPAPYQGQSAGPMQSQLPVTTLAVTTLTVPAGTLAFKVCVRSGASAINYTIDGSTPLTGATGNGSQVASGQCFSYSGIAYANAFKAIGATATTAIDVEYQK